MLWNIETLYHGPLWLQGPEIVSGKKLSFSSAREYEQIVQDDCWLSESRFSLPFFFLMWLMNPFMILPQFASPGPSVTITLSKALRRPWKWPIFPQRYQILLSQDLRICYCLPCSVLDHHPLPFFSGLLWALPSLAKLPTPPKAEIVF